MALNELVNHFTGTARIFSSNLVFTSPFKFTGPNTSSLIGYLPSVVPRGFGSIKYLWTFLLLVKDTLKVLLKPVSSCVPHTMPVHVQLHIKWILIVYTGTCARSLVCRYVGTVKKVLNIRTYKHWELKR